MAQADTYFPKVRRMLLYFSPLITEYFKPPSTLLHGHIALATLSLPETSIFFRYAHTKVLTETVLKSWPLSHAPEKNARVPLHVKCIVLSTPAVDYKGIAVACKRNSWKRFNWLCSELIPVLRKLTMTGLSSEFSNHNGFLYSSVTPLLPISRCPCSNFHPIPALENSMLYFRLNLLPLVSRCLEDPNFYFLLWASPDCWMNSNSALLCLTTDHVYSSGGFLSFAHQFWLLVQHDDFRMEMSLLGVIFLIFHTDLLEHRLVQEVPVLRWMFSEPGFTKII